MQLGFVTALFPELSLQEILEFAAETGYDCVEVMCWPPSKAERRYAGVTHIDVAALGDKQVAEIQSLVRSTGVKLSALGDVGGGRLRESGCRNECDRQQGGKCRLLHVSSRVSGAGGPIVPTGRAPSTACARLPRRDSPSICILARPSGSPAAPS